MSSVSSRYDEKLRQAREEYENREAERAKKRNNEIRRLRQQQAVELENAKENYDEQVGSLQEKHRELLTERDQKNNRQIEDLRGFYRDSLRKKFDEHDEARARLRDNYEGEISKQKEISESQRENLRNQLNDEVAKREFDYQGALEEQREKAQEVVVENNERLNRAFAKEREALTSTSIKNDQESQREYKDMQRALQLQLRDQEQRRELDNRSWADKYHAEIEAKNEQMAGELSGRDLVLREELQKMKEKYQEATIQKFDEVESAKDNFREDVMDRFNSQVRSRDNKIKSLEGKLNHQIVNDKRMRDTEKKNVISDYEKKLSLLEEARQGEVEKLREINGERIAKQIEDTNRFVNGQDRYYKSKLNMTNERNRADRENTTQQHRDEMQRIQKVTDKRVRDIQKIMKENHEVMDGYHKNSIEQIQTNYVTRIEQQRDQAMMDQVRLNNLMSERFRKLEGNFEKKFDRVSEIAAERIQNLKEQHEKEIASMKQQYEQRAYEAEKAAKLEKSTMKIKYENQIAQIHEAQQENVERMSRRHEEDMQALASKVNSYSRKA